MSDIHLDAVDAIEVVEILEFLTDYFDQLSRTGLRWLPLADTSHRLDDMTLALHRCRDQLLTAKLTLDNT